MIPGLEAFQPHDRIPKHVRSERLELRQYRMIDIDEFHTLYQSSFKEHLEPWSPVPEESPADGRKSARHHILTALDKWDDGTDYRFFIVHRDSGRIVGQLGVTQIVRGVAQSTAIGYWIGRDHVKQGYATEAVVLALKFAFESIKLHRATLWIAPGNAASLRVAEKLGLRFEGTALRALFLGREWKDMKIFAITAEEWRTRATALIERFAPGE